MQVVVGRLSEDSGEIAIVGMISSSAFDRKSAHIRPTKRRTYIVYVEVFVTTPPTQCEVRDPKGLCARARQGEIKGLTGIGAPYEPPVCPDIEVRSGEQEIGEVVDLLIAA